MSPLLDETWDADPDPLAALQGGDPGPFEAFVRQENRTLRAFFRRLGARPAEAEDLCQDTLVKLYRHAASYRPEGRFRAYALRIARNAWIDRARRRSGRPDEAAGQGDDGDGDYTPADVQDPSRLDPAQGLVSREQAARLSQALRTLPEHHRLVFELGMLQELPYSEVAATLDIPEGTVKSRMFHAVRKLRSLLGDEDPGPLEGSER